MKHVDELMASFPEDDFSLSNFGISGNLAPNCREVRMHRLPAGTGQPMTAPFVPQAI